MEPPSPRATVTNATTRSPLPRRKLSYAVERTLVSHRRCGAVHVLLTDDAEIRRLNRQYRGKDCPTDVLTFPAPPFEGAPLGEIAISVDAAERQAAQRKISLTSELAILAIHGALHLCGLNDETPADYATMQAAMAQAAKDLGLRWSGEYETLEGLGAAR